ncbi:MAG TPA: hypothetical protein VGV34_02930 [Solirubrobacterales bacterium]|nr:hypothetical protein [Solirubrobacterales bacterium]
MPLPDRVTAARRHLDRHLFPDPEPSPGAQLSRGWNALLAASLLALAVVLQLARIGWTGSLDTLWAEDGAIYLQGALTQGFFDAITSEYNGYLVLVPRLIGEFGAAFRLADWAAAMATLSAVIVALCGFAVWHATAGLIVSRPLRAFLAGLTVLTSVGGVETVVSAANVPWFMLVAAFWLLLWRPRTYVGAGLAALFVALTALSTPGTLFFLPLALLRALAVRDGRDLTILGAYFGANLVQGIAMARSTYEQVDPVWTPDIWDVLVQRVVDGTVFGLRLGGEVWAVGGWTFLYALTAILVLGLALGLWRTSPGVRYLAALAIPIALAAFVFSVYQRAVATPMLWLPDDWNESAGRYAVVPVMLLLSVILAMVDRSWRGRRWGDRRTWVGLGLTALLVGSALVSLPARNVAARGTPPWSASVEKAERTCAAEPQGGAIFDISPPGFLFELPCSTVPASSDAAPRR